MLRRENDGFFNLRSISFLIVALVLVVFSIVYGDWYGAKVTGHAVIDNFVDFEKIYITPYLDYVESTIVVNSVTYEFSRDLQTCVDSRGDNCVDWISDCALGNCDIYVQGINGIASVDESYNQFLLGYINGYFLTPQCSQDLANCADRESCPGEIILCVHGVDCSYIADYCQNGLIEPTTAVPDSIVAEISNDANRVSQSAEYASTVNDLISANSFLDSELINYADRLQSILDDSSKIYEQSSLITGKYSSYILSQHQESIVSDISLIESVLRKVNDLLTKSTTERLERQMEQASWELNHEDIVQTSLVELRSFSTGLIPLSSNDELIQVDGTLGSREFDLVLSDPGIFEIIQGTQATFNVMITNYGDYVIHNCIVSFSGKNSEWLTWQGFDSPIGTNSLSQGQSGTYTLTVNPTGEIGFYPVNFMVSCDEGVIDGFTITIKIIESLGSQTQGQTGEISQESLDILLNNYPVNLLNSECQSDFNICNGFGGAFNTCGEYSYIYDCADSGLCNNFEAICIPNYIPPAQLQQFIEQYVSPYFDLPTQCLNDVSTCSGDSLNCPDYVSNCALNGNCDGYIAQCLIVPDTQLGSIINSGSGSGGLISDEGALDEILNGDSSICRGGSCNNLGGSCMAVDYLIATSLEITDLGNFGYNPYTGDLCSMSQSNVYLRPEGLGFKTSNSANSGVQNQQQGNVIKDQPRIVSIHFQNNAIDSFNRNYVAAVAHSLNGHLTLNFFSSPNYNDLEDKIYEYIQKILYGKSEIYVTEMSLQQAEEIVNKSASVPWVLWIILFVMVTSFLFFGNLLLPYQDRLIYSGKRALGKRDYAQAIDVYNELALTYSKDLNVRQDALNYLKQIRNKIGNHKIDLEFTGVNSLPKIKIGHSIKIFGNYSRVEKMIQHALQDVRTSPKLAIARMPIISEEYRKLNSKDKESLASHYESLIYKLRNIK